MYQDIVPWMANYDESEVPPFTVPDVLACLDGTRVRTAADWLERRRPELLRLFRDEFYGETPPLPDSVEYETLSERRGALQGRAVRREVRLRFRMRDGREHSVVALLYLPIGAGAGNRVPVFVGLTFGGNHVVSDEPDIRLTGLACRDLPGFLAERGCQKRRFPLETIVGRGYAIAVASYHDFFPDHEKGWKDSVYRLFRSPEELEHRIPECSAIGAWAWGLSRMLDHLETVPEIDAGRAAVFGHSRLGKTSLWAGAQDRRFGLVCVNDSGCGGAALSRRLYGETLFSMFFKNTIGRWWFRRSLQDKAFHPEQLPFDQHCLLALVAPRGLAVHSATEDQWADPRGEYLATWHAAKVFALLGKENTLPEDMPDPDDPVGTDVAYLLRTGEHDLLEADWKHYLDMADRCL